MTNKTTIALLALTLALFVQTSTAEAGGPTWHGVIFANMTPDAESGGESSRCAKTLMQEFKNDDWLKLIKKGETKIRAATGVPKGGANFMTWTAKQFQTLKDGTRPNDEDSEYSEYTDYAVTVVLVDCRPAKQMLDVLAIPAGSLPYRLSLRGVNLKPTLIKVFAKRVFSMAENSFTHY